MKTVSGLKIRPLGGDFILVPTSGGSINFNKIISFNQTAAYLWESVSGRDSFSLEDLADLLVGKYGIDAALAASDADTIARKWLGAGIITE